MGERDDRNINSSQTPKSVRQKRILSIAAEQPDASITQIADEVATATPDVVEEVLEEYGDPAEQSAATTQHSGEAASSTGGHTSEPIASSDGGQPAPEPGSSSTSGTTAKQPTPSQSSATESEATEQEAATAPAVISDAGDPAAAVTTLTPKQRETLAAIQANPEATQRELADILGISAPTVSNRVNGISGFEWSDRRSFIRAVLEAADTETIEDLEALSVSSDGGDDSLNADTAADAGDTMGSTAEEAADSSGEVDASDAKRTDAAAALQPADLQALIESLEVLTDRLASEESASPVSDDRSDQPFAETELLHKVIHACMEAETISEDEELEILKRLT